MKLNRMKPDQIPEKSLYCNEFEAWLAKLIRVNHFSQPLCYPTRLSSKGLGTSPPTWRNLRSGAKAEFSVAQVIWNSKTTKQSPDIPWPGREVNWIPLK